MYQTSQAICLFCAAITLAFIGCGSGTEPTVATDQDELARWVAENPAPPTEELSPMED